MHIEKLKYYLDLYECRNFTETAKKNFISQAALSQFISSLEKDLQIQLFDRSVNPIEPTVAGVQFYEECKILNKQYENTLSKMEQIKKTNTPVLRIAYSSSVDIQSLLPIIPRFREKYPNVKLQLNKINLNETEEYLKNNLCDLVISFSTEFVENKTITYRTLSKGKYLAMIGKDNPLYCLDSISTAQLYEQPLIMLSKKVIGNLYDKMIDRARSDGYEPLIEKTVDDLETEMFYIITEGLIGFAPESQIIADYGDAIKLIPIVGSNHGYIVAAGYLKDNKNAALKAFLDII